MLVIACGAGVTAGAVSISPLVENQTIAEIEPLVPKVVSEHFGAHNYNVVRNPKVKVHVDDARHFLITTKQKFDGITSDPFDPWVKGAATLYTREFWELAKSHLNPGGVVTVFVQLYESGTAAVKSGLTPQAADLIQELLDRWPALDDNNRATIARTLLARVEPQIPAEELARLSTYDLRNRLTAKLSGQ